MKPYFLITLFLAATIVGCQKYDDTLLQNRISDVEQRLIDVENRCYDINQELKTLRELVDAVMNKDGIYSIAKFNDEETGRSGYTLNFTSGRRITILDGQKGADAPLLGVRQDTNGIWYWTLGDSWLIDNYGHKFPVSGQSYTPQFKIVDGYWQVSYDDGNSWTTLGQATGSAGDSIFRSIITDDPDTVTIVLADGTTITLPRYKAFSLTLGYTTGMTAAPGATLDVPYQIESTSESVQIETIAEGVKATVIPADANTGIIRILIGAVLDADSKVLVFAVADGDVVMRKITFDTAGVVISSRAAQHFALANGQSIESLL